MAINTGKVVVGGLAAGVVLNVVGIVGFGMILGPSMNAEMDNLVRKRRVRHINRH